MCLIGANVKVNVIAPHFGEGGRGNSQKPLTLLSGYTKLTEFSSLHLQSRAYRDTMAAAPSS